MLLSDKDENLGISTSHRTRSDGVRASGEVISTPTKPLICVLPPAAPNYPLSPSSRQLPPRNLPRPFFDSALPPVFSAPSSDNSDIRPASAADLISSSFESAGSPDKSVPQRSPSSTDILWNSTPIPPVNNLSGPASSGPGPIGWLSRTPTSDRSKNASSEASSNENSPVYWQISMPQTLPAKDQGSEAGVNPSTTQSTLNLLPCRKSGSEKSTTLPHSTEPEQQSPDQVPLLQLARSAPSSPTRRAVTARQTILPETRRRRSRAGPPLSLSCSSDGPLRRNTTSAEASLQKQRWLNVLRGLFAQLAADSPSTGENVCGTCRVISKCAFLQYFPLPGVLGERLFDLVDRDKSGTVDFEEFFRGLCVIYNGTPDDRRRFLFGLYDLDGNGFITPTELEALLTHVPAALSALSSATTRVAAEGQILGDEPGSLRTGPGTVPVGPGSRAPGPGPLCLLPDVDLDEDVKTICGEVFQHVEHPELGLSYEEFCRELNRNSRLTDVLDLFYDLGMPDLPVPQPALTVDLLATSKFSSGIAELRGNFRRLGNKIAQIGSNFRHRTVGSSGPGSADAGPGPTAHHSNSIDGGGDAKSGGALTHRDDSDEWKSSIVNTSSSDSGKSASTPVADIARTGPTDSAPDSILHSGYLFKVGRKLSMRHRRYYVLRDKFLYYYSSPRAQTPKKVYFLKDAKIFCLCRSESRHYYGLQLNLANRSVRLFSCSSEERDCWVAALRRASSSADFHSAYRLLSPKGRGKFAVVHRAVERSAGGPVAVKILKKKSSHVELWRTEISAMRLLRHRNIVQLYEVYDAPEFYYLVMEWVEGGDLGSFLRNASVNHADHACSCSNQRTWSTGQWTRSHSHRFRSITLHAFLTRLAKVVAQNVAAGLQEVHRRRVIHRDLKPENILMGRRRKTQVVADQVRQTADLENVPLARICEGCSNCEFCMYLFEYSELKIGDFGLSKILTTNTTDESLGTLSYAAPEVIRADLYSTAVDLWSLGVILTQIFAADRLPFEGSTESEICEQILAPQACSTVDEKFLVDLSSDARDLVRRLLLQDPQERLTAVDVLNHPFITNRDDG